MLHRLALAGGRPFSYGSADKNNKFLNAGALEKTETAYIRGVHQYNRIRALRSAFEHQQRRDLHHPHRNHEQERINQIF